MTMSDRLGVMREGKVDQVGPPQEVYESPATEFVAGFLGASNLLEGTVGPPDGELRTVVLSSGEKIRVPTGSLHGMDGAIKLGVRPEKIHVRPAAARPDGGDNEIEGTVKVATFVGVSNVYTVETQAGRELTVYAQNLGTSADRPPSAGERVVLTWHPEHTFVVEAQEEGAEGD
jgi:spermidine/putrescine transport system ATP-binding protein